MMKNLRDAVQSIKEKEKSIEDMAKSKQADKERIHNLEQRIDAMEKTLREK
jgi:uncharacterized protein Yka (UPF0111/DUF47 family)